MIWIMENKNFEPLCKIITYIIFSMIIYNSLKFLFYII